MKCKKCNDINLTDEETIMPKQCCLKCDIREKMEIADKLNQDYSKIRVNVEAFGRSREEALAFKLEIENEDKNQPTTTGDENDSFVDKVNKQMGKNIFYTNKDPLVITVTGANEDVKLTLELPDVYPVHPDHYQAAENVMQEMLEMLLHGLAFGPLVNTTFEQYLAQRFQKGAN